MSDMINDVREKGADFMGDLGQAVRRNPVSAALIGMGVLWLFTGGRTMERAGTLARRAGFDRIPDAAEEALAAARSSIKSGAGSIGDGIASATETLQGGATAAFDSASRFGRQQAGAVSDFAQSLPGAGADMLDNVRSNLNNVFKAQPLALGAIGLAIGAGLAAALPQSTLEGEYLGEASDAVKARAAEFAAEQAVRATGIADEVVDTVAEEARKQGLTVEGVKSAVGDLTAKFGRVADAAGAGVSRQATFTAKS